MQSTIKEIKGILNIELGSPFHDKTEPQKFKLSHVSGVEGKDLFLNFKSVVVNIDPLNKKVFQIYSYLSFPTLDVDETKIELNKTFNQLKAYFTELHGENSIRIDNDKQVVFSITNNEISIILENNTLFLECTDQILRHNCYALLAAY